MVGGGRKEFHSRAVGGTRGDMDWGKDIEPASVDPFPRFLAWNFFLFFLGGVRPYALSKLTLIL